MTERIYLSIDCDYFAEDSASGSVNARRLLNVLDIIDKPVYVTMGHDLHAFDVTRHRVNKLINVDFHSDCYTSCQLEMDRVLHDSPKLPYAQLLQNVSMRFPLAEYNWPYFCHLVGKTPCVEHWRPHDNIYYNDLRNADEDNTEPVRLISKPVEYKNRIVDPKHLAKVVKAIKQNIVAVGVAISPNWCERYAGFDWSKEFFGVLRTHCDFNDASLYSADECVKDPAFSLPRKKTSLNSSVMLHPKKKYGNYYSLVNGSLRICISSNNVMPHLPSITKAANSFAKWRF